MDLSSVLAYKSCFFATRAKGTSRQFEEGRKYTASANAVRCAITASQTVVPLFGVSECLSRTAANASVKKFATDITNSSLQNIAGAITGKTTANALTSMQGITKCLSKLGLVGNLSYAAAKCMDAEENRKNEVLCTAVGNCAGMYLFENLYSHIVTPVKPAEIPKEVSKISKLFNDKIKFLKDVKFSSILLGLGFVAVSLTGSWVGEEVGKNIFTTCGGTLQPQKENVKV